VVIGGSAGSIEALKSIVRALPSGFSASIFVTVHVSADFPAPSCSHALEVCARAFLWTTKTSSMGTFMLLVLLIT